MNFLRLLRARFTFRRFRGAIVSGAMDKAIAKDDKVRRYGAVANADTTPPRHPDLDEPPVGSAEFSDFVRAVDKAIAKSEKRLQAKKRK